VVRKSEIQNPLKIVIQQYILLANNERLFNIEGYETYSKIIILLSELLKISDSKYLNREFNLLPHLEQDQFTDYENIVYEEIQSNQNFWTELKRILSPSKQIPYSSTEEHFAVTLQCFKRLHRILIHPELEDAWNESFENQP